jgi:hypothetical protein
MSTFRLHRSEGGSRKEQVGTSEVLLLLWFRHEVDTSSFRDVEIVCFQFKLSGRRSGGMST